MPSRPRLAAWLRDRPPWAGPGAAVLVAVGALVAWWVLDRSFLDPPRPRVSADALPLPDVPPSVVAAPIRIPLPRLVALLEEAVPRTYGSLDERHALAGRERTDVAFHLRRDGFRARVEENQATLRTTIRYALRAFYDPPVLPEMSASCGTDPGAPEPRLAVAVRAPVTLDQAWRLRTEVRVLEIAPASDEDRDRCRVTFLDVDVTGTVVDAARRFLEGHVERLDSLAAAVDVRSSVEEWWGTLQAPIRLTDSLWLTMRPEAIQRGSVVGRGDTLDVPLALTARPSLHYGPRPSLEPVPLPPLQVGEVPARLDLRVEARVEYEAASGLLLEELKGRAFVHDGRRVRIDSLAVFGIGGGRVALEILVSGDVSARLYLVGTPAIDPSTGTISVPDLDFDVATRSVVLAAVSWLRADELREVLRERSRWPAAPAVAWMTRWLGEGLNRDLSDDLHVEGGVGSVRILGVYALRDALVVRVAVGGSARLFVAGPDGG